MRGLLALPFLLLPVTLPGCGPGAECVVDTDCPFALDAYCSAEHVCVPRGTGRTDAGGARDGGAVDGGARDASTSDARSDAPLDAAPDAPVSSCPAVTGTYPLTRVGIGCSGLTASTIVLAGPASAMDCSYEVALDDRVVGAVAQTTGNTFSGTLSVFMTPAACTLAFADDLRTVDVTCDRCTFSAARP